MKRFLLVLGLLAGVLTLSLFYFTTVEGTHPLQTLRSWGQTTPGQSTPAVAQEAISVGETRAMIQNLATLRVAVAEYYQTMGSLPRTFKDVEMPDLPHTRFLENGAIEYLAGGRTTARVHWLPRPTALRLDWDCLSPDIVNIAQRVEGCRYSPSLKPGGPIQETYSTSHRLLFEFDRSDDAGLGDAERVAFQQFLANAAVKPGYHPLVVQITGYADPMGDVKRNIHLAEGRAAYAREAIAALGIDRATINLRIIGADPRPVRDCPASLPREERILCFSLSRRVDVVVSGKRDL